jgi:hypothetical protein
MFTFWSLFGIVGGTILVIYLLIKSPVIIRDFKNYYSQKKLEEMQVSKNKQWMTFLYSIAKKQQEAIQDSEVKLCWDLFVQCIESIQTGFGNWGAIISVQDIDKLIETLASNITGESEGIGEDTFYIELLDRGRAEVSIFGGTGEQCRAVLLLTELEILKKNLPDYKN